MKIIRSAAAWIGAVSILLSILLVFPVTPAFAAGGDISATYASYLNVKALSDTQLLSAPDQEAVVADTISAGTELMVCVLIEAADGSFWYQVKDAQAECYVSATEVVMTQHLVDDLAVTGLMTPAALGAGEDFTIGGNVSTGYNALGAVTASVHKRAYVSATPVTQATGNTDGKTFSLQTLNDKIALDELEPGSYTFVVKAQLISHYIDSEGALMTTAEEVIVDRKNCVVSDGEHAAAAPYIGVDVSNWTGAIDWATLASHIDFAILKVGSKLSADRRFLENAAGCETNGIPYGVYHVTGALTEDEAVAEAEFVLAALEGLSIQLPVYVDVEYSLHNKLSSEQLQAVVRTFCETIRAGGYEPGVFSYTELFETHFADDYFSTMPKWISEIDMDFCSYSGGISMWQYSWSGRIAGISADVDLNYYYGELPGQSQSCEHPHWDYALRDGVHEISCGICGETKSVESIDGKEFKINSASLRLSNDITMLYYVTVPAGFKNPKMVFEFRGNTISVTGYSVAENGRYCFAFEKIRPHLMGENIRATLYATVDGVQVSKCVESFSIQKYCMYQLAANPTDTVRQLLSDILIYGEKAQVYYGHDVDNLVSSGLSLSSSTFTGVEADSFKFRLDGTRNETADFTAATLMLRNSVAIRFVVSTEDPTPYTYRITMNGINYDYTSKDLVYSDGRYSLDFAHFGATRFDQEITATILLNGQQVSRSVTYSVNSYIYTNQNCEDEALRNLLHAVYNYGRSTEQYVKELG